MRAGETYKVVAVSPDDAFYADRAAIIGMVGTFTEPGSTDGCFLGGEMVFTDGSSKYFYRVQVAPSSGGAVAMPEPAPWGCPPGAVSHVREGERIRILHIHNQDAYYNSRGMYEGKWGRPQGMSVSDSPCYFGGSFNMDDGSSLYFYKASFTRGGSTDSAKPKLSTEEGCPEGAYAGTLWPGQRVSVLEVHDKDAWTGEAAEIEGQSGEIQVAMEGSCWLQGAVRTDDGVYRFFHKVAVGEAQPAPEVVLGPASRKRKLPEGASVQIVDIHYFDAHAANRDRLVGKQCSVVEGDLVDTGSGWLGGHLDCGGRTYSFFRVRVSEQ